MDNLLAYSGIATKVRAMQSHLITDEQFREMAALDSVRDAVEFLRRRPAYEDIFSSLDDSRLHRGMIEELLALSMYRDFAKLYLFSTLTQRKFLDLYFMHYEIGILKKCLRNVLDHRKPALDLSSFQEFFEHHSKLDLIRLAASRTLEELIDNMEGSLYYDLLIHLNDTTEPTLFDYEIHLDLLYFDTVWKIKSKYLSGSEQQTLARCYGSTLDLLNIQWIYRSKKYYHLSSAEIYSLLIPTRFRLKKEQITRMTEAASLDEFYSALANTCYGSLPAAKIKEKPNLEDLYERVLGQIYHMSSRKEPYSIACLNSYLYFKELELHKIITIIECIRYGLDTNETISYVVKN